MEGPLWCAVAVFFALDAMLALSLFEWWVHECQNEWWFARNVDVLDEMGLLEPLNEDEEHAVGKFFANLNRIHDETKRMHP